MGALFLRIIQSILNDVLIGIVSFKAMEFLLLLRKKEN